MESILILLLASVLVIGLARRVGLPAVLGYLVVGMLLGPLAFGFFEAGHATQELAEIGVVFMLFTLGLDFSWPRMVAMRREVFGLGLAQTLLVSAVAALALKPLGLSWAVAVVLGGALSMSSTAIVLHQLTDQSELNRTHGRLSFAVLLFQDIAFVPFLALGTALSATGNTSYSTTDVARLLFEGLVALGIVLAIGRWLLKPALRLIAHSRLRELFTLSVLLVVLASAWITQRVGLSMALGAFLSGMMLAETEFRYQVESVIRPFRELLLGLFFISVGMLLDLRLLYHQFFTVSLLLVALLAGKTLITAICVRAFVPNSFRALRTGIVLAGGGEFGVALFTILLQGAGLVPERWAQPLLASVVLSMIVSPLIIRYNKPLTRRLLGQKGPPERAEQREEAFTFELAKREHVILCGFGRVGQNIARVLESQGFEYIAIDLDPARIRLARQVGDPVVYGDSSDEDLLQRLGLDQCSAVVISFADTAVALGIVRAVRHLRADVPILVRTQDDSSIEALRAAGATEVVPETFEASLMLVSQALTLLNVPVAKVMGVVGEIRSGRYATLRSIHRHEGSYSVDGTHEEREELRSVLVPPGAWSVGKRLSDVRGRSVAVGFTAIRRHGITGREPALETELREGDLVVIYGTPEALEHAEAVLLAG